MDGGGEHVTTYAVRGWAPGEMGVAVSEECNLNHKDVLEGSETNVIVWQEASPLFRFAAKAVAASESVS